MENMLKVFGRDFLPGLVHVIIGALWGDEGKGKIAEYVAQFCKLICRFNGGPNAGHNISIGALHQLPCGISNPEAMNLIADDCVIDIFKLLREIDEFKKKVPNLTKRLIISKKAHIITPIHILKDKIKEIESGANSVGSTQCGIAPVYGSFGSRDWIRVGDLMSEEIWNVKYYLQREEFLVLHPEYLDELWVQEEVWMRSFKKFLKLQFCECAADIVHEYLERGEHVLAEGAQGIMLDPDFGYDKYVTASRTGPGAVCNSLGVGPHQIGRIMLVTKCFTSRVGNGPFPSEFGGKLSDEWCRDKSNNRASEANMSLVGLNPELARGIEYRRKAGEYGATTGRPRRTGAFDYPLNTRSVKITGADEVIITFTDFFLNEETVPVCTTYSQGDKILNIAPVDISNVTGNIEEFNSWSCDLTKEEKHDENLKNFIVSFRKHVQKFGRKDVVVSAISCGKKPDEVCAITTY